MHKLYFIFFLLFGCYKSATADECLWENSCYKRPPLIVKFNYGFHINFLGQLASDQSLFYNVTDEGGNIVIKNTQVVGNSIDFINTFSVDHLDSSKVYNQSKEYTLTVYGVKVLLSNGNYLQTAIPIRLSLAISGFYADEENGGNDNILDYKLHGQVSSKLTINKSINYSFSEEKNDMWLTALNDKDHKVYAKAWNKNNPNNPNVLGNKVIVNVSLPYTMPFISVKDTLVPLTETKDNKFF